MVLLAQARWGSEEKRSLAGGAVAAMVDQPGISVDYGEGEVAGRGVAAAAAGRRAAVAGELAGSRGVVATWEAGAWLRAFFFFR